MTEKTFDLASTPVHLGLDAKATPVPGFDGSMEWYQNYGQQVAPDGKEGRLVGVHSFSEDWSTWEMHPEGAEVVYLVSGKMTLVQEVDGDRHEVPMTAGQAAINPPGVWHTAKVIEPVTALFITAGLGTKNEVRD